jgi:hypothetical protein
VTGDNLHENVVIMNNELKKACIEFMTAHNPNVFGAVEITRQAVFRKLQTAAKPLRKIVTSSFSRRPSSGRTTNTCYIPTSGSTIRLG